MTKEKRLNGRKGRGPDQRGSKSAELADDQSIRALTAASHKKLDATISQFDIAAPGGYGLFLSVMAQGFAVSEAWLQANWRAAPSGASLALRSGLAADDLAKLLAVFPDARISVPRGDDCANPGGLNFGTGKGELMGVLYTLEGSRLGARYLRTQVPAQFPRSFLEDSASIIPWADLRVMLLELGPDETASAVMASRSVFGLFQRVAEACLPPVALSHG